ACRREDPGPADPRAIGVHCRRPSDGEGCAPGAVETRESGDVTSARRTLVSRGVGPQHRPVLAAQEIAPPAELRGRTDEEVGTPVTILVTGERQVPSHVLPLGLPAAAE